MKWTNLAQPELVTAAAGLVKRPAGLLVADILDPGRVPQPVERDDIPPYALCNKVGQPRAALPTLVSCPASYEFRNGGPGIVWDNTTQRLEEPRADERERALGFRTGTIAAPGLTERQRRKLLGQAMDLRALTWGLVCCVELEGLASITTGIAERSKRLSMGKWHNLIAVTGPVASKLCAPH
eukprot:SM000039S14470  [mRNA]  locus=s39:338677:339432:+ [translate_table: standard]